MSDKPKHLETREMNGAREYSPSAGRNIPPLLDVLTPLFPDDANVLEIASGTGQHAAAFCAARPDITWQSSDPHMSARASQNAWSEDSPEQMKPALEIDVLATSWWAELKGFDAMFCANMIHIAPSASVAGLAAGASALLSKNHKLFLYGPFQEGAETATSNLNFDESLKRRDPDWGVRHLSDVKHIFATHGLELSNRIVMPKENRLLIFKRS